MEHLRFYCSRSKYFIEESYRTFTFFFCLMLQKVLQCHWGERAPSVCLLVCWLSCEQKCVNFRLIVEVVRLIMIRKRQYVLFRGKEEVSPTCDNNNSEKLVSILIFSPMTLTDSPLFSVLSWIEFKVKSDYLEKKLFLRSHKCFLCWFGHKWEHILIICYHDLRKSLFSKEIRYCGLTEWM